MTVQRLPGFASAEGTLRFMKRFDGKVHPLFFKEYDGLRYSTMGIGSYLGDADDATDALYEDALREAILGGINVIDTAANYRFQRSERAFGRAIQQLVSAGTVHRDELLISTKGGFIPFDGCLPDDAGDYVEKNFVGPGIISWSDLVQDCHCLTPDYLEHQLQQSLRNLGLETIDIYYLHNPETQLAEVPRTDFLNRITKAFAWAEAKVREGKIRAYGTATWSGYRVKPESPDYLSLEDLCVAAREAGGAEHHFKAIQLPVNIAMLEAWALANQRYGAHWVPVLGLVARYGLMVMGSGTLLQSRLAKGLPAAVLEKFNHLKIPAQCAIQFARSVPGMGTALIGMKTAAHVKENLKVAQIPPMTEAELFSLFQ